MNDGSPNGVFPSLENDVTPNDVPLVNGVSPSDVDGFLSDAGCQMDGALAFYIGDQKDSDR